MKKARKSAAALLLLALWLVMLVLLSGCTLVTEALDSIGFPVGSGASEAAKQVDAAIRTWLDVLLWGGVGIATSESARATHRTIKKRRAKKAAESPDPRA